MRRFLYFIPGHSGANAKTLAMFELLDRFTGPGGSLIEHCVTAVAEFPKGHGCIVSPGPLPPPANYASLEWIFCGGAYVALEDATLRPRPADLERELGIAGPELLLADGQSWRVPLVRRWDGSRLQHACALPKSLKPALDGNGKMIIVPAVQAEYAAIDKLADRLFSDFCNQTTMPLAQACADAAALLAVNYRIGLPEAGLLGLLSEENVVPLLAASIDYASLQAQAHDWALDGLHAAEPRIEEE